MLSTRKSVTSVGQFDLPNLVVDRIVAGSIPSGAPNFSSRSTINIFLAISRSFAKAAKPSLRAFLMAVSYWMRGTFPSICSGV